MKDESTPRLGILRSPLANIGEEVVLRGAEYVLKTVFDQVEIIEISGYPAWVRYRRQNTSISEIVSNYLPFNYNTDKQNFLDPSLGYELDLLVVTGCSLYPAQLRQYESILKQYSQTDTPIVFLGTGSTDYSSETVSIVRDFLSNFEISAVFTRDSVAYEKYQGIGSLHIMELIWGFLSMTGILPLRLQRNI